MLLYHHGAVARLLENTCLQTGYVGDVANA